MYCGAFCFVTAPSPLPGDCLSNLAVCCPRRGHLRTRRFIGNKRCESFLSSTVFITPYRVSIGGGQKKGFVQLLRLLSPKCRWARRLDRILVGVFMFFSGPSSQGNRAGNAWRVGTLWCSTRYPGEISASVRPARHTPRLIKRESRQQTLRSSNLLTTLSPFSAGLQTNPFRGRESVAAAAVSTSFVGGMHRQFE